MKEIFSGNEVCKEIGDLLMMDPNKAAPIILKAATIYGRCKFSPIRPIWRLWYRLHREAIP